MVLVQSTKKHIGKTINRFEDQYGNPLDDFDMVGEVIIVFDDETKLRLGVDHRGVDTYISQYVV